MWIWYIVLPAVVFTTFGLAGLLFYMKRAHDANMKKVPLKNVEGGEDESLFGARPVGNSTLREEWNNGQDFSCEMTSGSGSGFPKLIARSFAKDIVNNLQEKIGGGRYGNVWKGTHNGDYVAIKIFNTRDEDSFRREIKIYNEKHAMNHDNILRYTIFKNTR